MVIKKIEGKTTCLYRKLVWRGVELSHCDLISVLHGSYLFLLCFHADRRASNCIIARNSLSFYNHIKMIKKAHKCFGLLKIPSWVLVNISKQFSLLGRKFRKRCLCQRYKYVNKYVYQWNWLQFNNICRWRVSHMKGFWREVQCIIPRLRIIIFFFLVHISSRRQLNFLGQ